jgi:hypothetical protein
VYFIYGTVPKLRLIGDEKHKHICLRRDQNLLLQRTLSLYGPAIGTGTVEMLQREISNTVIHLHNSAVPSSDFGISE